MSTFVLKVHLEPKFWRRHCSTGLERNSCIKLFSMFPPRTKILESPQYSVQFILYIYQLSLVPPPQIFICGGPHDLLNDWAVSHTVVISEFWTVNALYDYILRINGLSKYYSNLITVHVNRIIKIIFLILLKGR